MKNKSKPNYSLFNNVCFALRQAWEIDKNLMIATFSQVPIIVLIPLCGTYLSKSVVQIVSEKSGYYYLFKSILFISIVLLVLNILKNVINAKIEWSSFKNRFSYINICSKKVMDIDYENIESASGQIKMQKAFNCLYNDNSGAQKIFSQIVNIASNFFGLIVYSIILGELNPVIVFILFTLTIVNYIILRKNTEWFHNNKDNWVPIERKMEYIKKKAGSFEIAKDIRLYNMSTWLKKMFNDYFKLRVAWWKKSEKRSMIVDFSSAIISAIRDGVVYFILIYQVVSCGLNVSDFVLYYGLITRYSTWLLSMFNSYNALHAISLDLCDFRDFLDTKDNFNRNEGALLPNSPPEIVFKNVSYRYTGSDNDVIKNFNLKIKNGEKIAIVGLNGAGKTTLVKLISGLYAPTNGLITVNGIPITNYCIYEYYSMLSVVFQEIMFMPVSISQNISLKENKFIQKEKVRQVLMLSGIYEKIQKLPDKENTIMLKSIIDGAVDFSGGEKQKLALARALYQDGKIMVLDEPTAALDPISENEIYIKYNQFTEFSTSVFISHRLASTRFCDRILFLENGKIAEEGSHEELMALGGKYAELYKVQSQYYR